MRSSILSSIVLHLAIMMMAIVSLPIFNNPDLEIPPIVQVELIEISEKTNVPKVSKKKDKPPNFIAGLARLWIIR